MLKLVVSKAEIKAPLISDQDFGMGVSIRQPKPLNIGGEYFGVILERHRLHGNSSRTKKTPSANVRSHTAKAPR